MARILIVDDDPHIVEMLTEALTASGYEVASVTHSLRAFDHAKEFRPHLILMDLMMPYLDGVDQVELLSMDSTLSATPVIAITANPRGLDRRVQPRHSTVVARLEKPFSVDQLLDTIEGFLPRSPEAAA